MGFKDQYTQADAGIFFFFLGGGGQNAGQFKEAKGEMKQTDEYCCLVLQ